MIERRLAQRGIAVAMVAALFAAPTAAFAQTDEAPEDRAQTVEPGSERPEHGRHGIDELGQFWTFYGGSVVSSLLTAGAAGVLSVLVLLGLAGLWLDHRRWLRGVAHAQAIGWLLAAAVLYKPLADVDLLDEMAVAWRQNDTSSVLRAFLEVVKEVFWEDRAADHHEVVNGLA